MKKILCISLVVITIVWYLFILTILASVEGYLLSLVISSAALYAVIISILTGKSSTLQYGEADVKKQALKYYLQVGIFFAMYLFSMAFALLYNLQEFNK